MASWGTRMSPDKMNAGVWVGWDHAVWLIEYSASIVRSYGISMTKTFHTGCLAI